MLHLVRFLSHAAENCKVLFIFLPKAFTWLVKSSRTRIKSHLSTGHSASKNWVNGGSNNDSINTPDSSVADARVNSGSNYDSLSQSRKRLTFDRLPKRRPGWRHAPLHAGGGAEHASRRGRRAGETNDSLGERVPFYIVITLEKVLHVI